jgi:hypothetical protein
MRYATLTLPLLLVSVHAQRATAQEVITKVKRSGPKVGGRGAESSEWYLLESDPAPPGYVLTEAQFKIEGSAECGANAQCVEGERTQTKSTWLFRIQGAGGTSSAPAVPNYAVLTTKYRRSGPENTYTVTAKTPERFSSRGGHFGCFEIADERKAPERDGPWCSLSAPAPKPGYRIKSASFSLGGDRSCVGNDSDREVSEPDAECRLMERTDTRVTWRFRMLGHTEGPSNAAGKSFGTLRVVYEKTP